jgi:AraC family transcriptional regulator of adaptative response / DNA-3-methyladenine glycosylase II
VLLDAEQCQRICRSGDPRFDGWFIVGVTSTGIYCRPSCPARTPKPENMRFLPSAAAAQSAGFRACKRCRPDASPGSPEWNIRADAVGRAVRLIADGEVDRGGVESLASRLGYSSRHLNRILLAELGAGPLALARAQRCQTARVLIETTAMAFTEVAFAAGFASIRQFNDSIREVFASSPTELRDRAGRVDRHNQAVSGGEVRLRLAVRQPFDAAGVWHFLGLRLIDGVEEMDGDIYRRTLTLPRGRGVVELRAARDHVDASLRLDDLADLTAAVQRCRRLLDLDADPVAVDDVLGPLGPAGARVPGAVDGWELAARAVVGQQVSLRSAAAVLRRLVAAYGDGAFPTADRIVDADPATFGMPLAKGRTLIAVARAVTEGRLVLDAGADRDDTRHALLAISGIGPWTAGYVAMRALGDPDVFLEGDVAVRKGLAALGLGADAAEGWRPWRSYAVVRLWRASALPTDQQRQR